MSTEDNKALVRRITEQLSKKNLDAALAAFSPDFQSHATPPPGIPGGIEGSRQFFTMLFNAFPDIQITSEDMIAEGDRVVERLTARGTHTGVFMGIPPTGKHATWGIIGIYRIAEGKVAEVWNQADQMGLMQQLGVIPLQPTK